MFGEQKVSLETLGGGPGKESSAAVELFNLEFQRVIDNCLDENTKPDAAREVTLKVKIKPDKDRERCSVEIAATSKLAPVHPYPTQFWLGKEAGKAVAVEDDPKQRHIFKQYAMEQAEAAKTDRKVLSIGKDE